MKIDEDDIWEGGSLNQKTKPEWNYTIQKMVDSYDDNDLLDTLKVVLLCAVLIVLFALFLWGYVSWIYEAKEGCSQGDLSACVEYQWILPKGR